MEYFENLHPVTQAFLATLFTWGMTALGSAKKACYSLNIPVRYHFKTVFVDDGQSIHKEYLFSHLACYLITMNADSSLPAVARAQLYFFNKK